MMIRKFPAIVTLRDRSLDFQNTLLPFSVGTFLPDLAREGRLVPTERSLFAYRIPELPDFLSAQDAQGDTGAERFDWVLSRHLLVIANLAKWKGQGFALRFIAHPDTREIETYLVIRTLAPVGRAEALAEKMAADVTSVYSGFELTLEPITDSRELEAVLNLADYSNIVEVRQHEAVVPLSIADKVNQNSGVVPGAYVVCPYLPARSNWQALCRVLLSQTSPTVVNIILEPTILFEAERKVLADAAAAAKRMADYRFSGTILDIYEPDPVIEMVSRLYSALFSRLGESPFCVVAQVASEEALCAWTVAQTLGAEITRSIPVKTAIEDNNVLPSGFDVVAPHSEDEWRVARHMLTHVEIASWGRTEAVHSPGKERLRYLCDAEGASCVFRFPIATLSGLPGIATRTIIPDYEIGPRLRRSSRDGILLGDLLSGGGALSLPINRLTRHMLIAGNIGSGKTTTCMQILDGLYSRQILFLVMEPKTEYRGLIESSFGEHVQVFTLGEETTSPFRLNPFEILPGVAVEAHASRVAACIEAAMPLFGSFPSLIEEAIYAVYLELGWKLEDYGDDHPKRAFPTLGQFYQALIRAAGRRGLSKSTYQDIVGIGGGRISRLLHGSNGKMLNTQRSIPMKMLMTTPTILEMKSLSLEERALVTLFLLTAIREYCETERHASDLQHVTVIEEAHTIMRKTDHQDREISGDTAAVAVEMLSALVSEIRSAGEGIIISEQIPNRLVEDATKLTTTKIVHKLQAEDDRKTIAGTMSMTPQQEAFLAKLEPGQAALFTEGYERPAFVWVRDYVAQGHIPLHLGRQAVVKHMEKRNLRTDATYLPFSGCKHCLAKCQYRDHVGIGVYRPEAVNEWERAWNAYKEASAAKNEPEAYHRLASACKAAISLLPVAGDESAAYCYLAHNYPRALSEDTAIRFRSAFRALNASRQ